MTSTMLTLLIVWTIVAMALWCCYRLWYWAPTATIALVEQLEAGEDAKERAA